MTIAIFCRFFSDSFSGGRYAAWTMGESLAMRGHRVVMICDRLPLFYPDFEDFSRVSVEEGTRFCPASLEGHVDVAVAVPDRSRAGFERYTGRILDFISPHRSKLVLLNFETPNWIREYVPGEVDELQWYGEYVLSRQAAMILSISREGDRFAREYFSEVPANCLFDFCHPAINSIAADAAPQQPVENQIIALSRFEKHKQTERIEELLDPAFSGYRFVLVVGTETLPDDGTMPRLERRAEECGMALDIRHRLSTREKFIELKKSRLLVHPSSFEGYGLPPVEASYCNTRSVVFDLPVLREVNGDALYYAKRNDFSDLKKTMRRALGEAEAPVDLRSRISPVAKMEHYGERLERSLSSLV